MGGVIKFVKGKKKNKQKNERPNFCDHVLTKIS